MKHYLLALTVEEIRLFVAVGQDSRKMSDSLLVMGLPKEELVDMKCMSTVCGKEVTVKDKIENLATFASCDLPTKTEHTEYLETLFAQAMTDPGAIKIDIKKDATILRQSKESQIQIRKSNKK